MGTMDREAKHHYRSNYEGLKSTTNNGNSTTGMQQPHGGKGGKRPRGAHSSRCLCFGTSNEPGRVHQQQHKYSFFKGFLVNLGICSLLVAYTLLGSFLFLTIESRAATGGHEQQHQRTLAAVAPGNQPMRKNATAWLRQLHHESRARTVEKLWDITVNLNILYRENWTRLAAVEIAHFQDELTKTLTDDILAFHNSGTQSGNGNYYYGAGRNDGSVTEKKLPDYDWNFARSFLYSLTVLTTIGYGCITPRSTLGKIATMAYASVGIPLTLVYLSSAGGLLSRCARGVFTRALCCCLCSNCGYCCYDERQMQEKEKRMRKRRQQEELAQQQQQLQLQEPFYVRANASTYPAPIDIKTVLKEDVSSLSSLDRPTVTIFAPISICLGAMICYIVGGAITLNKLEGWTLIDATFFCFMSLSTIGFGDMVPGSYPAYNLRESRNITLWFCSCYIMSGMALTAMCFNILHDEIVHRLNHAEKQDMLKATMSIDELSSTDPFVVAS